MTTSDATSPQRTARVRCAIYTRKSSEEGLEQEFNSLQAQREACEAFVTSQRRERWVCLPKAYADGGLFHGNSIKHALNAEARCVMPLQRHLCRCAVASARKIRSVDREMRWR